MNKHLLQGVLCGGIFAAAITWIAMMEAMTEGGAALLASVVFGLAAGLCIGGLIAANFAMLAVEQKEATETVAHRAAESPASA
jgi:MFS family permease